MADFHLTQMGQQFYSHTMVAISKNLKKANDLKEVELELKRRELELKEKELNLLERSLSKS